MFTWERGVNLKCS